MNGKQWDGRFFDDQTLLVDQPTGTSAIQLVTALDGGRTAVRLGGRVLLRTDDDTGSEALV